MNQNIIWSDGIELALNDIKENSLNNSESHKNNYYFYKSYLKYFRVPTIILSGMNSVFSVGLQPYISQNIISVLCCSISLICGIIASVELFLGIQNIMERELISSKGFYILSYDIFKILSIEREHRMVNGKTYLDDIHLKYCNLIENANLLDKNGNREIIQKINNLLDKEKNNYINLFEMENINKQDLKQIINSSKKNYNKYKCISEKNNEEEYKNSNNDEQKINIIIKENEEDFNEEKQ